MARRTDRDDPLSTLRHSLRRLRAAPGAPDAARADLLGAVEVALFRLPPRQREIVRRYDLGGESAADAQRAMALSPRQFFRDRHKALVALSERLTFAADSRVPSGGAPPNDGSPIRTIGLGSDATLAGRTFARSLAQAGSTQCLRILGTLASEASDPLKRTDLLLELVETALDFNDENFAAEARASAAQILSDNVFAPAMADWMQGRLARAQARVSPTQREGAAELARSTAFLQRSIAAEPGLLEARAALASALGDDATLRFALGTFGQARAVSSAAVELIAGFGLTNRPRSLEIMAMHSVIGAMISGRMQTAIAEVSPLLQRAAESGWSSTASRLGAVLVGLNGVRGNYGEAIRWYRAMTPLASNGAKPSDRTGLTIEAAHSYTMLGQPAEALSILGYVRPGDGSCPRTEVPDWHALAAAALDRLGDSATALREANEALEGYRAQRLERGAGDAHRLIATSHAKLGNGRAAREHLSEARRITESYGTPYQFLRTLTAEAKILRNPALERTAVEYATLLSGLART
ncbi:MAG TPA: hypothetical protein VGF86_09135 [Candidatus Tumulicola sp.]